MNKPYTETKRAIIMGGTSGIGRELVKLMAARGWIIGVAGRRADKLKEVSNQIENVVATATIDITSEEADDCLLNLIHQLGGIDLYFHSSGIGFQNPTLDTEKELATVTTNAVGFARMLNCVFHYFENECNGKGHITVISSIAGTKGLGAAPAYSSTKRFQNTYMECLEQLSRMKKLNIQFTDIRPGFVQTALLGQDHYPLLMSPNKVARSILQKIEKHRTVAVIDWRYAVLVALWKLIPRWIWVRLRIATIKV